MNTDYIIIGIGVIGLLSALYLVAATMAFLDDDLKGGGSRDH
jgi:glycine/D-amino acid oxidase-like deaminating enzyme